MVPHSSYVCSGGISIKMVRAMQTMILARWPEVSALTLICDTTAVAGAGSIRNRAQGRGPGRQ